jgi:hypothetical protein
MHEQPVKAGLAASAEEWEWSSARAYAGLPEGVVTVERVAVRNEERGEEREEERGAVRGEE